MLEWGGRLLADQYQPTRYRISIKQEGSDIIYLYESKIYIVKNVSLSKHKKNLRKKLKKTIEVRQ